MDGADCSAHFTDSSFDRLSQHNGVGKVREIEKAKLKDPHEEEREYQERLERVRAELASRATIPDSASPSDPTDRPSTAS
jgi:hypothetical protein